MDACFVVKRECVRNKRNTKEVNRHRLEGAKRPPVRSIS